MKKNDEILKDMVDAMFIAAGYNLTYDDVKDDTSHWYDKYTWSYTQQCEFKQWATDYLKRTCKYRTTDADKQASWFLLGYGLRVKYPQTETDNA